MFTAQAVAGGAALAALLNYQTSSDGLGHWIHWAPVASEAVLRPPPDDAPLRHAWERDGTTSGIPQLVLSLACRERESPLGARAWIAKHPRDRPAQRFVDRLGLAGVWRALFSRPDPTAVEIEVEVRVGDPTRPQTATVRRTLESYSTETDYEVALSPRVLADAILGLGVGAALPVRIEGQRAGAPWRVAAAYRLTPEGSATFARFFQHCPPP